MNTKRLEWENASVFFEYHAPDERKKEAHESVREELLHCARFINQGIEGDSREKSLAITKLEEAMFWANAALARNPRPENAK